MTEMLEQVVRRSFLTGLVSLVAAPAIVRVGSLMPVRSMVVEPAWPLSGTAINAMLNAQREINRRRSMMLAQSEINRVTGLDTLLNSRGELMVYSESIEWRGRLLRKYVPAVA